MTVSLHARLAPSSADRWVNCSASPAMEAQHPEDEESEASREGTAAHWALEQLLAGVAPDKLLGLAAPNAVPVRKDMIDGAQLLVDDIHATLRPVGAALRVEERVDAQSLVHPDNWGTPDAYLLDRARRILHVWDFKFGHRYVDAWRNWQLIDYAACIMESEGLPGELADWSYTFTIAQPRNYAPEGPIRYWECPGAELAALVAQLRAAAWAASEPTASCHTGEHCRDCRAQWDCVANQRVGGATIDMAYAAQSTGMDVASLGLEGRQLRQAMQRLKARSEAVDARILGLIRSGQTVPHHALGWTKPRTIWREGVAWAVAAIGDMFGVNLRKGNFPTFPAEMVEAAQRAGVDLSVIDVPLVTPKQAVDMGIDAAVISDYAQTPPSSPKLVEQDDGMASRVFGNR